MEGLAQLASLALCAGAALAAASGDRRFAVLGLAVALLAAPLTAIPWPATLPLAFREVAALTTMAVLWVAARAGGVISHRETRLDAAIFVVVAFAAVVTFAPSLGPDRGPTGALASSAAAAVAALALGSLQRHPLASGLSAVFLLLAASLAVTGLTGPVGSLEHAVIGASLLIVSAGAALGGSAERPVPG